MKNTKNLIESNKSPEEIVDSLTLSEASPANLDTDRSIMAAITAYANDIDTPPNVSAKLTKYIDNIRSSLSSTLKTSINFLYGNRRLKEFMRFAKRTPYIFDLYDVYEFSGSIIGRGLDKTVLVDFETWKKEGGL